ncbi:MAG: NAD(P)H-dependent oxidoreductase [Clostridia bacterium]|nr:NAD(P)H-dependent oxidoreductase [Clostridia bacterium]
MKHFKTLSAAVVMLTMVLAFAGCGENPPSGGEPALPDDGDSENTLVVYFSCTNTTKRVAEYIQEELDCDIYEIVPETPYTSADLNYNNNSSRSSIEQNDTDSRPAISGQIEDFEKYDVVFIGYPIWWGIAPRILYTFVESYDFTNKTVIPFCTSGGSGVGNSATELSRIADGGEWKSGTRLSSSQSAVVSWVKGLAE